MMTSYRASATAYPAKRQYRNNYCEGYEPFGKKLCADGNATGQLRRADVRLIEVNEGVDTDSGFDDDFLPFRDVINEYYATDISKKICSF